MSVRLPDSVLVSSVNGGGVFLVGGGGVERWSKVDTTGIAIAPGNVLLARQAEGVAELRWLQGRDVRRVRLVERSLDLHDVRWHDDRIHVVATQLNTVFEFDQAFVETNHWTFPGEEDSQHINSVCRHGDQLLASRFGRFKEQRGYKGNTRGAGEVFDVETGEVLVSGLSQPHSVASHGGCLWVCDSEAGMLRRYKETILDGEFDLGGYVRGLAFGATMAYVGLSRSRNAEPGDLSTGCIVALDLRDMAEVARFDLPADEVYDIQVVDPAMLDDLRTAAFADAVAEYDTLVDARNRLVHEADSRADVSVFATRLHEANLRIAALEAENAALASDLVEANRRLATDDARIREDAHWLGMLEVETSRLLAFARQQSAARLEGVAECTALRAALGEAVSAHVADVERQGAALATQDELIAALRGHIDSVARSRSWRWTRMLRRAEPVVPAIPEAPPDRAAAGPSPAVAALAVGEGTAADELATDPGPGPSRAGVPIVGLAFEEHEAPLVTVMIAAYGNFAQTRACLESIRDAGAAVPFEVVVVEDGSGDVEMDRFASVPGVRYRRNPENLGFLRSINSALEMARGRYLHLLNDDTTVRPGWLDALLRTFTIFQDCGMAGSKLVYPDGILQEAGGIVWSDGDACNFGRGGDPGDPALAAVREVDYVSGASLLLRTADMRALDGFDERYAPAYYEDTDLAFRLRERGLKTYYQPASVVVHHEGLSHGTDPETGGKAWQARNREVFRDRWARELVRGQLDPGEHVFLARCRAQLKKIVLVVDRHPPHTDRDAGSRAIWQLMQVSRSAGFQVVFWSYEEERDERYHHLLEMHGIDLVGEGAAGLEAWVAENGRYLDYVVLSRPLVADAAIDTLRRYSEAALLYYGHDVHHLRMERQHAVEGMTAGLAAQARSVRLVEERLWRDAEVVLYPSDEEAAHVNAWLLREGLPERAAAIPLFAFDDVPELPEDAPGARRDVLFVGGFAHAPNADGVAWFARDVWPLVRAACGDLRLVLVGADPPDAVLALAADDVVVAGGVSEEELARRYASARVVVAPLRFGAGTKGKVIEAMRHGVPCVTTSVGAQGLADATCLEVADAPAEMAGQVVRLATDETAWRRASQEGQAFVRERFTPRTVWSVLSKTMDASPYPDVESRRRRIAASSLGDTRPNLEGRGDRSV